jgi:hypothetical protein
VSSSATRACSPPQRQRRAADPGTDKGRHDGGPAWRLKEDSPMACIEHLTDQKSDAPGDGRADRCPCPSLLVDFGL